MELKVDDILVVMSVRGLPRLEGRHEYTESEIAGATFAFGIWTITAQETRAAIRVPSLVEEGWKKFQFHSEYYGSHPEYGEGEEDHMFLFHRDIDISRWEGVCFAHGHHSESEENKAFHEWLEGLVEGEQYIEQ